MLSTINFGGGVSVLLIETSKHRVIITNHSAEVLMLGRATKLGQIAYSQTVKAGKKA
jgi:hypothetical protein